MTDSSRRPSTARSTYRRSTAWFRTDRHDEAPSVKHLLTLALASAWNRRFTLTLTLAGIALSVAMLLGVERMRTAAHESFAHSISGTDLVVGPRTSPVQLMLYAVFRIGEATTNMKWSTFQELARDPEVAWIVPVSIG